LKFCLKFLKICLHPGMHQNPMLITVSKYIEDYWEEIWTSEKYPYNRNMLITGMIVSGMQCIYYWLFPQEWPHTEENTVLGKGQIHFYAIVFSTFWDTTVDSIHDMFSAHEILY
jgi:hypothetical protein